MGSPASKLGGRRTLDGRWAPRERRPLGVGDTLGAGGCLGEQTSDERWRSIHFGRPIPSAANRKRRGAGAIEEEKIVKTLRWHFSRCDTFHNGKSLKPL